MRPFLFVAHLLVAALWLGALAWYALGIAVLGNQARALEAQRGKDLQTRMELAHQQERIKSALDWEASQPHLADAVRRLDLPLVPPPPTRLATLIRPQALSASPAQ